MYLFGLFATGASLFLAFSLDLLTTTVACTYNIGNGNICGQFCNRIDTVGNYRCQDHSHAHVLTSGICSYISYYGIVCGVPCNIIDIFGKYRCKGHAILPKQDKHTENREIIDPDERKEREI